MLDADNRVHGLIAVAFVDESRDRQCYSISIILDLNSVDIHCYFVALRRRWRRGINRLHCKIIILGQYTIYRRWLSNNNCHQQSSRCTATSSSLSQQVCISISCCPSRSGQACSSVCVTFLKPLNPLNNHPFLQAITAIYLLASSSRLWLRICTHTSWNMM